MSGRDLTTDAALVERAGEAELLERAVTQAAAGKGSVVVVGGEAGIGKTSLLSHLRRNADDAGLRVLTARGSELEQGFAFGVVRALLEPVLNAMDRHERSVLFEGSAAPAAVLLGAADPGASVEPSPVLLNAVYWVLAALSAVLPLGIVVDDAQWADSGSMLALAFLAKRVEELPIVLAIAARTAGAGAEPRELWQIAADSAAQRISPAPLTPAGVHAVAAARGGWVLDDDEVAALHAATRGNPLFVTQILDALRQDGITSVSSALTGDALSLEALRGVVLGRVARLSADARAVARAVATLGDGAPLSLVADLAGLSPEAALEAAAELSAASVFDNDAALSFVHPMIAAAVAGDGGAHASALGHLRAARLLRTTGASAEKIASHLLRTLPAGDYEAVAELRAAGATTMRRGAPASAATLLRRAVAEAPDSALAAEVGVELGIAELEAGEYVAAAAHLNGSAEDDDAPPEIVYALGNAVFWAQGPASAVDILRRAGERRADDRDARAGLLGMAGFLACYLPREARPPMSLPDPCDLAGSTAVERVALAAHAFRAPYTGGRAATAAQLARRALGDGLLVSDGLGGESVAYGAIAASLCAEALEDAERELAHYVAAGEARAWSYGKSIALAQRSFLHLCRGDAAAAEADARTAMLVASEFSGVMAVYNLVWVGLHLVQATLAHSGPAAADAALAEIGPLAELGPAHVDLLPTRGAVHLASLRPAEALADLTAFAAYIEAFGDYIRPFPWRGVLAEAQLATGDEQAARATAGKYVAAERHWGAPGRLSAALRTLARTHAGEPRELALLEEAITLVQPTPLRLEHARCEVALGLALRRAGRRTDARTALERGADIAYACHAAPLVTQAHEELSVLGARPRRYAFSGAGSLTASERRAAELAAAGATNRQIAQQLYVTVKTVESHLANAYRKLDIRSRRQLAAALSI